VIRSRLFRKVALWQLTLILLTALAVVLVATPRVERETLEQVEETLAAEAAMLRDIARPALLAPENEPLVETLATRLRALGKETGSRFTVIAVDGRVLADSLGLQATMTDPHANRPEIQQARETGKQGTSTRYSRTTNLDLRYLALPVFEGERLVGFARASMDTKTIESRRKAMWGHVGLGVAVASVLALVGGLILSRRFARRLGAMSAAARRMARGEPAGRLPTDRKDEEGDLARAIMEVDSQLRERLQALGRERNQLSGVLASMSEGVVAVDREQRIVHMNAVAAGLLRVRSEDVLGKRLWETTRVAEIRDLIDGVLSDGEARTEEVRVADHPPPRRLQLNASALKGANGDAGGAVLVLHDVTGLRRLESMRTDFVANVSHELKTPLAAIQGLIETLADDGGMDGETRERFLERARSQVVRLSSLVTDLLSLSQVESESRSLERHPLDLREVLEESAGRIDLSGRSRRLALDLPDDPVAVLGDGEALGRIVDNLLDNAVKYTEDTDEIHLRLTTANDTATIEVQDTGIGIEPNHHERIFERFYRVDKARSRELGGTGLGLAIVRHLVEAQSGRIEVESVPGRGSTFRIHLPLEPLDAPMDRPGEA
jgi:two-component system phosphate regulon sensor histidine kinase PhoR